MSIQLERLTKHYGGHAVVNAVSLDVTAGEFFVLLGPSGSGKSTLLRMIAGLAECDTGSIALHGRDVTGLPPQARDIGFVFQQYALFPSMTAADNIEFGLRVRRMAPAERRKRREELLDLVGLAGLGGRLPRQLSGGQQQRVALARALAPRPSVLLLDEPFGALDAKIRVEMRHSLRQIQREVGITTIFVTHDQEEAFELGERLGIMHAGRLLEIGPPDELYLRPDTEFTASFLGTANILVGEAMARSIQVGPITFPLRTEAGTQAEPDAAPRRVQVLIRPEDLVLASAPEGLHGTPLGEAEVESRSFAGTFERLRLRLRPLAGVRSIAPYAPFGTSYFPLEATRLVEQAELQPLQPGDPVWVGVQRLHALRHPGLSLLIVCDGTPAAEAALALGASLARQAHARLSIIGAGISEQELRAQLDGVKQHTAALPMLDMRTAPEPPAVALANAVEAQPCDVLVLGSAGSISLGLVEAALGAGDHHLLLAGPPTISLPARMLVCVAANEPSKEDVLFAGRLARHLGAETTLLSVVTSESDEQAQALQRQRAERFLEAGQGTLAQLGITARPVLRVGSVRERIEAEMAEGSHDLLVLGAPLHPLEAARIRHFLTGALPYPVLIVRSPATIAGTGRLMARTAGLF